MDYEKFDTDPEALAWARSRALKLAERFKSMETHCQQEGMHDKAQGWGGAIYLLEKNLIGGSGCTIAAFDERIPDLVDRPSEQKETR
jgi:hypothetical protein